jgi:hypothetical protein
MRKIVAIVAVLLLIACGKNFFSGTDKTRGSDAQEALDSLDNGDPTAAYESILKTLSAEQVAAIEAADSGSADFEEKLVEAFKNPTPAERNNFAILSKTMMEKPGVGVNLIDFSVELSNLSKETSLALACTPDPNFKKLINAVRSVTDLNQVFTARIVADIGIYTVTIAKGVDGVPVVTNTSYPDASPQATLNAGIATIIAFASMLKNADTDGDGAIGAAEAAVFFETDPAVIGITRANTMYNLLNSAVGTLELFSQQQEAMGKTVKGVATAIDRMKKYRDDLAGFKLVTNGVAEKTSSCAYSIDTPGTTRVKCVSQWLVAVTSCAG